MRRFLRYLLVPASLLLLAGCEPVSRQVGTAAVTGSSGQVDSKGKTYQEFLTAVAQTKKQFRPGNQAAAGAYLCSVMNGGIASWWSGTPWDFNGTTRIPGQGAIACGYFVTNVLADLGFKIQRVKLARQVSSVMIKELTADVQRTGSMEGLKAYLDRQKPNTVCIVGLDFHTGFILKTADGCYFLHANYINREGVIKESIGDSQALNSSKSFMIGSLTGNQALLAQWIRS